MSPGLSAAFGLCSALAGAAAGAAAGVAAASSLKRSRAVAWTLTGAGALIGGAAAVVLFGAVVGRPGMATVSTVWPSAAGPLPAAAPSSAPPASTPVSLLWAVRSGLVQCYGPDQDRRTCESMAAYSPDHRGGFDDAAVVLISRKPPTTMKIVSAVQIAPDRICGVIRPQDLGSAQFVSDGRPLAPAAAAQLRQRVHGFIRGLLGRRICTTYAPDEGSLVAKASVDGVARPDLEEEVIWVSPGGGYTVAP